VNGFVHNNPVVRSLPVDKFETPNYISTTGLDFSEDTTGANTVRARVGDLFYRQGNDSDRTGGISINDGRDWAAFGQLDNKSITNSATAGWETFDVGAYLAHQKAAGATSVTLVVRASTWMSPNTQLTFSSREGINPPEVLVNGNTTITPTADAMVNGGATATSWVEGDGGTDGLPTGGITWSNMPALHPAAWRDGRTRRTLRPTQRKSCGQRKMARTAA